MSAVLDRLHDILQDDYVYTNIISYAFYNYIGRWYQVSEDWFENVFHWTQWWSFVPKVAVDQTLWGPFWNNSKLYFQLLSLQLVVKSNIQIFAFI